MKQTVHCFKGHDIQAKRQPQTQCYTLKRGGERQSPSNLTQTIFAFGLRSCQRMSKHQDSQADKQQSIHNCSTLSILSTHSFANHNNIYFLSSQCSSFCLFSPECLPVEISLCFMPNQYLYVLCQTFNANYVCERSLDAIMEEHKARIQGLNLV